MIAGALDMKNEKPAVEPCVPYVTDPAWKLDLGKHAGSTRTVRAKRNQKSIVGFSCNVSGYL